MKNVLMNISHFCFIVFNLKIFVEIVTPKIHIVQAKLSDLYSHMFSKLCSVHARIKLAISNQQIIKLFLPLS